MDFTRRETLAVGGAAALVAMLPKGAFAATTEEWIAEFTGGAEMGSEGITLTAPEIAENGNTVPIEVDAPGAEATQGVLEGDGRAHRIRSAPVL